MSNVVAFKRVDNQQTGAGEKSPSKSMTLFIHVKRTTLIAHCGNLQSERTTTQGRVGKGHF